MPLDPKYLEYERQRGMDHNYYDASNLFTRKPITWPGGKPLALWITVSAEFFPLTPNEGPFRAAGHMVTPFPDYRTFTTRDYGNRVGIYRIMRALKAAGFPVTAFVSSALIKHAPPLIHDIRDEGWEIAAHGVDMNALHFGGMTEQDEASQIRDCLQAWQEIGVSPTGWMSPGRSQSQSTLDLLVDAGITWTADWGNDDMPYNMKNGLTVLPFTDELEDRKCLVTLGQREDVWIDQVLGAADWLSKEADQNGGRVLHLALTPYIIGQPFRINALNTLLDKLAARSDIWAANAEELMLAWQASSEG